MKKGGNMQTGKLHKVKVVLVNLTRNDELEEIISLRLANEESDWENIADDELKILQDYIHEYNYSKRYETHALFYIIIVKEDFAAVKFKIADLIKKKKEESEKLARKQKEREKVAAVYAEKKRKAAEKKALEKAIELLDKHGIKTVK